MPKYWVKNYFAHGGFPEVGQKQKTEERERKKERLNDGENNGQATHGARKHIWRTQAAWAKIVFKAILYCHCHKNNTWNLSDISFDIFLVFLLKPAVIRVIVSEPGLNTIGDCEALLLVFSVGSKRYNAAMVI